MKAMSTTGKFTRLEQPLSQDDKLGAVKLWERGFDTFDIARGLKVPEWQVYNGLPHWRAMKEVKA